VSSMQQAGRKGTHRFQAHPSFRAALVISVEQWMHQA
jgi:hypothetical protein